MLRKLAIAIAASGAMMSATNVLALGMGDIELESALNQPLDARIKLLKASELENWEMKPNLASTEEFEKSGVEHVFFLNNLQFAIERSGDDVFVHVTSRQAVVEPFLNFLVQVDWPNGRLLREYTLLLDPPVFNEEPAAPVQPAQTDNYVDQMPSDAEALPGTAPSASAQSETLAMPTEKLVQEPTDNQAVSEPEPSVYKVRANDTLWEVAIRTRPNRNVSPQQAMLAIQDLNPNAFINGNINRLKKNQVLRVPDEQQMRSRSFDEAVAQVAIQNQAIAKRRAQLDATRKDEAIQRDDRLSGAQLKLVAGGEATTDNQRNAGGQVASETAGDQSKLEKELSVTLENLDKTTRENQELRSRLDSLEEQINTLQRLVNLKDEQMVALQSGMAEKPAKPESEKLAPKEVEQPKAAGEDLNFAEKAPAEPEAVKKEQPVKPKPKVFVPEPVEEPFDPVAFVMENPPVLGAGLGALLLALLGINFARKRKEKQQEESAVADLDNTVDGPDPLDEMDLGNDFNEDFTSHEQENDLDLGGFDEGDLSDFESQDSDAGLTSSIDHSASVEDMIGEADGYMSYNRPEPARAVLEKAIESQPARMDLRLKMVEVLSALGDSDALQEQVAFINENGSPADQEAVAQIESGDMNDEVNEDFAMDFGLGDDLDMTSSETPNELDSLSSEMSLGEDASELDFDLDGLDLNDNSDENTSLDFSTELDTDLDFNTSDDLDLDSGADQNDDLDLTLGESADDSNSMDFDLGDFESNDDELPLEDIEEPVSLEADSDLDALSLDDESSFDSLELESGDASDSLDLDVESSDLSDISLDTSSVSVDSSDDFDFDFEESSEADASLEFDLPETSAGDIPELSASSELDELDNLSFETTSDSDEDLSFDLDMDSNNDESLDLGDLDASDELDISSVEEVQEETLPEFEEGLSFDEEEMDLPELTEEIDSDLDGELDALANEDIDLPTLEAETNDLDELPELNDDFDISVSTEEPLEAVEDVVAEYKEELPSIDDAVESDEFPPLGDLDDLDLENLDSDLDFLSGTDESETKLDLARAYIDMEDQDGAREILQEVLDEGSDDQKQEATKLMDSLV